jgi:tRNA pseudouridine38-40 synthase
MRHIKLTLTYDGTDFCGWQKQPNKRSIEYTIEKAILHLGGYLPPLMVAGRTDAGVHATGQVCSFITQNESIPNHKFKEALNQQLPQDVRVLVSEEVALDFNPRKHAIRRTYKYRLHYQPIGVVYHKNTTITNKALNMKKMNDLATLFVGTHNFSAFCSTKDQNHHKVREIYSAHWLAEQETLVFYISGNAFLMNMVRRIVGTIISLHEEELTAKLYIKEALITGNKKHVGYTAPAYGLSLIEVVY